MSRTKMMLFTVLVAALAVPSLWAQKKSIQTIKAELQRQATATGVPAVCSIASVTPTNYLAGTNKCSSSSPAYTLGSSLNVTVSTCADKGGVEGNWESGGNPLGMGVTQAGVPGSAFTSWGAAFNVGGTEYPFPDVYSPALRPAPSEVSLKLKRNESVFGFEISNETQQTYQVTFHTSNAGDLATGRVTLGGVAEPDVQALRFIAICNTAAITGVTTLCDDCSELSGQTTIGQIRGDKFPGF